MRTYIQQKDIRETQIKKKLPRVDQSHRTFCGVDLGPHTCLLQWEKDQGTWGGRIYYLCNVTATSNKTEEFVCYSEKLAWMGVSLISEKKLLAVNVVHVSFIFSAVIFSLHHLQSTLKLPYLDKSSTEKRRNYFYNDFFLQPTQKSISLISN